MVYRRSARRRSIVVLLVITSVTLITLDERGSGSGAIGSIRSGAHEVVAPVQRGVHDLVQPVSDWFNGVTDRGSLTSENRKLRDEVQSLRNQVADAKTLQQDNANLRGILSLPFIGNLRTVAAQVVTGAPGNYDSALEIDKGTGDGIKVDMPVVSAGGLLGRIVQASRHSSTVLLITDPTSNVAVRIPQSNNATGVASGRSGVKTLSVNFVNPDTQLTKDEPVVTAG
ncbi:MAG: rod shape-determining protein MreC, partial [Actinobacteria bacterium]|nr:rod shape-determining protein MreC [Actinomycetota bacterium]